MPTLNSTQTIGQIIARTPSSNVVATPNASPSQTLTTPVLAQRDSLVFTHMRTGVQLAPPPYIDTRYRWARGMNVIWYNVTQTSVYNYLVSQGLGGKTVNNGSFPFVCNSPDDVVLFPPATYPPDMPLLSLNEVGNLAFWDFPPTGATGRSFIDWSGFLQGYNADGTPSGSDYTYEAQGVDWLATYIQYYINTYLKTPYDVTALIPYGYNYFDQMRLYDANETSMIQFLSLVNFLKVPIGNKTFFDDVLNVAPTIVAGVVSVATLGLGTPALVGALAALALKVVAQPNLNKTQVIPAANQTAFNQQVINAPSNVNTAAEAATVAEAAGTSIVNAVTANPILYVGIAIAAIILIVIIAKTSKNG